jgi:hypothetical protein
MFGALLGLAGTLLSARSQRKTAEANNAASIEAQELQNQFNAEQAQLERANSIEDLRMSMPRLRESAEAAGYNPLTALMTGGAPAYAQAASGVGAKGVVPKLATPSLIGNVIEGVADIVTGIEARQQQEKRTKMQLQQINAERALGTVPKVRNIYTKTATKTASTTVPTKENLSTLGKPADNPQDLESLHIPKIKDGELLRTNPTWIGPQGQTYIDPRNPDSEHGEQRYGDIAQEITGWKNVWDDFWYNQKLQNVAENSGRRAANEVHQRLSANPTRDVDRIIRDVTAENKTLPVGPPRRPVRNKTKKLREFMRENYPTVFD